MCSHVILSVPQTYQAYPLGPLPLPGLPSTQIFIRLVPFVIFVSVQPPLLQAFPEHPNMCDSFHPSAAFSCIIPQSSIFNIFPIHYP